MLKWICRALLSGALVFAVALGAIAQDQPPAWPEVRPDESGLIILLGSGVAGQTFIVSDAEQQLTEVVVEHGAEFALQYRVEPGVYQIFLEGQADPIVWEADPGQLQFLRVGAPPREWQDVFSAIQSGQVHSAPVERVNLTGDVLYLNTEPPYRGPFDPQPQQ